MVQFLLQLWWHEVSKWRRYAEHAFPMLDAIGNDPLRTEIMIEGSGIRRCEIEGIKTDSYVVLGIVDNDTCICIVPVDGKDADLNSISCP
jgi:hypothetical protein